MQGFRGWIEDWEKPLLTTNDSLAEATLLAKYKNMRFLTPDDDVLYVIYEGNLEFQRGSKKKYLPKGWNVFGVPPDGETEDDEEPFMICEDLCEIIADTEQVEGVEVIKKSDELEEPRADPVVEGDV